MNNKNAITYMRFYYMYIKRHMSYTLLPHIQRKIHICAFFFTMYVSSFDISEHIMINKIVEIDLLGSTNRYYKSKGTNDDDDSDSKENEET